jgi:succinoglycan biosynthesis protein ExoL
MTRIAFFGHDAADAAVRRRVQGFRDDGLDVVGFTMRRRDDVVTEWKNVDLGRTFDGAYRQRIQSIFRGAKLAAAERELLSSADVIYARNLDMLMTAFLAKHHTGLKTPVIYEALDVHRLLTRKDAIGRGRTAQAHAPVGGFFTGVSGELLRGPSQRPVSGRPD